MPDGASEERHRKLEDDRRQWQGVCDLKLIYLDCGWDIDSVDQEHFRHDEILKRRKEHSRSVGINRSDYWA